MALLVSPSRIVCYYNKILMLQDVRRSIVCRVEFVSSVRKATLADRLATMVVLDSPLKTILNWPRMFVRVGMARRSDII